MPSVALSKILFHPIFISVIIYVLWKPLRLVLSLYRSPLRHLRGPKPTSLLLGNLKEFASENSEPDVFIQKWVEEHGSTLRFNGFLNTSQLITVDTRAINHILVHSEDYQKSPESRRVLAQIFGEGLIFVEGAHHRQQRRIMNPAFGPVQIRALTETFLAKADRLRDLWLSEIAGDPTATITGTRIDVVPWLNRVTLDIIGLTGFNYNFHALDSSGQLNELTKAFSTLFSSNRDMSIFDILRLLIPVLRFIPTTKFRESRAATRTMTQIGRELLMKAKANTAMENEGTHGRDLLSLLVKANMETDCPESQRMSDKDVTAQVPTFFVAGHETTSTAVAWALYAMTQAPDVQAKLRDELFSINTDAPSMDELMALPYFDSFVRETLRVHAPVRAVARVAMKDDELPVEKPYTDKHGVLRTTIPIAKGDPVIVPILAVNRSKDLWGPDALEFRPERWNNIPAAVSQVPGVWGHMLTFIGGPRACIGYRFSIVEIKAILFSLVRAFEFELAVPASEVGSRIVIVRRPVLRSDPSHESQLPLLVKPYRRT